MASGSSSHLELKKKADDDDDDDIPRSSSSSPQQSEQGAEWLVTRILAEASIKGVTKYLLEWEGFELKEATWEPACNLSEQLLADWRAGIGRVGKTAPGFKISHWREAVNADIRAKYAKHSARNRKLIQSGLEPQPPEGTLRDWMNDIEGPSEDGLDDTNDKRDQPESFAYNDSTIGNSASPEIGSARNETPVVMDKPAKESVDKIFDTRQKEVAHVEGLNHLDTGSNDKRIDRLRISSCLPFFKTLAKSPVGAGKESRKTIQKQDGMRTPHTAQDTHIDVPNASKASSRPASGEGTADNMALTVNVFVGGKKRRASSSLVDALSDPTRHQQFLTFRKRRLVEKALRDGEGCRPPGEPSRAFATLPGSEATTTSPGTALEANRSGQPDADPSFLPLAIATQKLKKRVRWADDLYQTFDSLFVSDEKSVGHVDMPPTFGMNNADTDSCSDSTIRPLAAFNSQQRTKMCYFGPGEEFCAKVEFSSLPVNESDPWVQWFKDNDRLLFSHFCSLTDLMSQLGCNTLQDASTCQGTLLSSGLDQKVMESVGERLRVGQLAVTCHQSNFYVAVFPPEASPGFDTLNGNTALRQTAAHLNYSILQPSPPFPLSMLAPVPSVVQQGKALSAFNLCLGRPFEKLFPNGQNGPPQNFFFMFTQAAYREATILAGWLREVDNNCTIRTSFSPGQWSEFGTLDRGIVILHEDSLWLLRTVPKVSTILHGNPVNIDFYIFSTSGGPSSLDDKSAASVCRNYQLRQAFQYGIVVFITPSFLVSQPEQAYNFAKFFWKNYTMNSSIYRPGKLAFCSDILGWLLDLAMEKAAKAPSEAVEAQQEHRRASTAMYKCWNLIRMMVDFDRDELCEDNLILYAPEYLDGNDEQSLVNWFGSWTAHHHRFRKFLVLGSSNQTEARLSRDLRPVRFAALTGTETRTSGDMGRYPAEPALPSQKELPCSVRNTAVQIRNFLTDVEQQSKNMSYCPLVLYRYPISFWDSDSGLNFGDFVSLFDDQKTWFNFFAKPLFATAKRRPSNVLLPRKKNTYIGLFYTLEKDGSQEVSKKSREPRWAPWIAGYRPVNLQRKPWKTMELLIWDPKLNVQASDSSEIYESELTAAQRELISFVRENSGEEKSTLPLERVWLGPFTNTHEDGMSDHLDCTLSWVENISSTIRERLPVDSRWLLAQGWKEVHSGSKPQDPTNLRHVAEARMDPSEYISLPLRTVIPAPEFRSAGDGAAGKNHFQEAVLKNQGLKRIPFTFKPTLTWYAEQLKNGGGFEHIIISEWQSVFTKYKIVDPEVD
ncbi:uncharacterized protein UV8b_05072 [Ustilaginoidea virens]|uniref:Chromo domain-containing protein n=1 Tax=Ustilaginoidea virens TaxID=1159556 RepID=A0A063BPE7_USTVR|nr:uncharacterized protein UV8b_05072 [Ustilaginoidea virens]QUC20831.1 hypothetical protein UV8b_05072 [Ustilaginoidea virens]GAO14904.1 hypothetical protein UVI_02007430 [Ustilaginoidea virens]